MSRPLQSHSPRRPSRAVAVACMSFLLVATFGSGRGMPEVILALEGVLEGTAAVLVAMAEGVAMALVAFAMFLCAAFACLMAGSAVAARIARA